MKEGSISFSFENCIRVVKSGFLTLANLYLLSKWKHSHWQIFEDLRADCIIPIPDGALVFSGPKQKGHLFDLNPFVSFLQGLKYTNAPCWVVMLFCNVQHILYLKSNKINIELKKFFFTLYTPSDFEFLLLRKICEYCLN